MASPEFDVIVVLEEEKTKELMISNKHSAFLDKAIVDL